MRLCIILVITHGHYPCGRLTSRDKPLQPPPHMRSECPQNLMLHDDARMKIKYCSMHQHFVPNKNFFN